MPLQPLLLPLVSPSLPPVVQQHQFHVIDVINYVDSSIMLMLMYREHLANHIVGFFNNSNMQ
jgi:hypothetical protein